ncbi:hypothetical protein CNMCM5793_003209 [Aspergillus hiratsukae]|uniref:SWR1-complex protein 5 n=1 Tax=Aspergillus hiratsukae TaxID=1194566 RepID=A0A8H6Q813_9EURO|nr:hypothetical protein CNMCM5793_003209 [Aspergillus hiratsukae]KAF7168176.1 hypothetical protein CNMCM6106_003466 [Aspergillus hiratsukae]
MASDPTATVADLDFDNEQYDSAEDEDFQLDPDQDAADLTGSDSDDEATEPAAKRRKTGPKEPATEDRELDSGDEAMIQKVKARKEGKQKGKKSKGTASDEDEDDVEFDDDDEGGPGGFVRTRAMRMRMHEERKPLAKIDGATVDVDAIWAQMNTPDPLAGILPSQTQATNATPVTDENKDTDTAEKQVASADSKPQYTEEMVKIKRTYKFAGEIITEEKIVPKDSAEAKLFLANGESAETVTDADVEHAANAKDALKLRRPLRKISRFDPNPTGTIKKSWEKQPTAEITGQIENVSGPKINTVEKSRLDWAAYVDQAGIKDELKVHSKAKEGFLGRMDFLDRVVAKREEERRNARLKGFSELSERFYPQFATFYFASKPTATDEYRSGHGLTWETDIYASALRRGLTYRNIIVRQATYYLGIVGGYNPGRAALVWQPWIEVVGVLTASLRSVKYRLAAI